MNIRPKDYDLLQSYIRLHDKCIEKYPCAEYPYYKYKFNISNLNCYGNMCIGYRETYYETMEGELGLYNWLKEYFNNYLND
jgi:hypothetical protein